MKALIWISTLIVLNLINLGAMNSGGPGISNIILLPLWWLISFTLCRKWDGHKTSNEAEEKGMTPFELIRSEIPQDILEQCEEVRGDENLLKFVLKDYKRKGWISHAYADILFQEYMRDGNATPTTDTEQPKDDN